MSLVLDALSIIAIFADWIHPDARLDGHAGAERNIGWGIVHDDLDRHPLDDL
jgi:hypothetical protein